MDRGSLHGSSGGAGQLYESDSGGAGETGKSDHQYYQVRCLRKSYSECAGDSVQYEKLISTNLTRADEVVFDHVGLTYAQAGTESLTDIDFSAKARTDDRYHWRHRFRKIQSCESDPAFL